MCCFSGGSRQTPIRVADTRIFARREESMQVLVYAMHLSTESQVAMILPLPVTRDSGENAVRFVSLARCPEFFDELHRAIEPPKAGASLVAGRALSRLALQVHTVGSFQASYVPTIADFARLHADFRLPDDVWRRLPGYQDYGFAVFKLRAGERQAVHPMAFTFPTRDTERLFFPTVHIHDGHVHDLAEFEHALYYQRDLPELDAMLKSEPVWGDDSGRSHEEEIEAQREQGRRWGRWHTRVRAHKTQFEHQCSHGPVGHLLGRASTIDRAHHEDANLRERMEGLVRFDWHLFSHTLKGELPNQDTWVRDAVGPPPFESQGLA